MALSAHRSSAVERDLKAKIADLEKQKQELQAKLAKTSSTTSNKAETFSHSQAISQWGIRPAPKKSGLPKGLHTMALLDERSDGHKLILNFDSKENAEHFINQYKIAFAVDYIKLEVGKMPGQAKIYGETPIHDRKRFIDILGKHLDVEAIQNPFTPRYSVKKVL